MGFPSLDCERTCQLKILAKRRFEDEVVCDVVGRLCLTPETDVIARAHLHSPMIFVSIAPVLVWINFPIILPLIPNHPGIE